MKNINKRLMIGLVNYVMCTAMLINLVGCGEKKDIEVVSEDETETSVAESETETEVIVTQETEVEQAVSTENLAPNGMDMDVLREVYGIDEPEDCHLSEEELNRVKEIMDALEEESRIKDDLYREAVEEDLQALSEWLETTDEETIQIWRDCGNAGWTGDAEGYLKKNCAWFNEMSREEQIYQMAKTRAENWKWIPEPWQTEELWRALIEGAIRYESYGASAYDWYDPNEPLDVEKAIQKVIELEENWH